MLHILCRQASFTEAQPMHWLTWDHWWDIQTRCQSQDCEQQVQQQPSCLCCLEPADTAPLQHLRMSCIFSSGTHLILTNGFCDISFKYTSSWDTLIKNCSLHNCIILSFQIAIQFQTFWMFCHCYIQTLSTNKNRTHVSLQYKSSCT